MSSVITLDFEHWKAQEAATGNPVVLDEFVFANIPGLDPTLPIDRNEKLPSENQIVHRQRVNKTGLASENAVAYSVTIGTEVGDFEFNWIGLLNKATGIIAMITHAPIQKKIKTHDGLQGNVLTRSFLLEFEGAAKETAINTTAETWQIDFTARLSGIDEQQRLINVDTYGDAAFFDDGFLVSHYANQYTVKRGLAYVGGLRGELKQDQIFTALRDTHIYADFSFQGNLLSQWETKVKLTPAKHLSNYVDIAGFQHFVFAIAHIGADGKMTDLRTRKPFNEKLDEIERKLDEKVGHNDLSSSIGLSMVGEISGLNAQLVVNILKKIHADPKDYGVTYGVVDSEQAKVDNTGYMQECVADADNILVKGRIEIKKGVRLRNGLTIRGINRNRASIVGFDEIEATLYDKTTKNTNNQNNNLWQCKLDSIAIRSMQSNAMHITPYQCEFTNLGLSSPHGACIKIHDGGYQVENTLSNNYFSSYKYGILALGGFRNFTDNFIIDNYFFANQTALSGIRCDTGSGSIYRGNHFYGGEHKESMIRLSGGSNVSISESYFEGNINARLWLDMGNPGSVSVTNNRFWRGDAARKDDYGDMSALIKVSFNEYNLSQLSVSSNVFEGGINNVPIFLLMNGGRESLAKANIVFDNSNVLNGNYRLSNFATSGSANYGGVIETNKKEFITFVSAQNGNFYSDACSEFIALDTGYAISYPVLPTDPNWMIHRQIVITNLSEKTELRFSSGAPLSGYYHIEPRQRVRVIYDNKKNGYLFLPL